MFFEHKAFWLPKDIEHPDEYQDAFAVDEVRGIAAIADGVSSSLFAASWARLLVNAATEQPPQVENAAALEQWLSLHRENWRGPIDVEVLAWHQKEKFKEGAFSTLMWLELGSTTDTDLIPLTCYSLGDCCFFHVRCGQVQRGFPFERSTQFGTQPKMVGSVNRGNVNLDFDVLQDTCRAGDILVLCTDALAVWILMRLEAGEPPGLELFWEMSQREWTEWVLTQRGEGKIRYDDTTLMMLKPSNESMTQRAIQSTADVVGDVKKGLSNLFRRENSPEK
ncbi:MAG: hypothetical protein VX988_08355 [Planctomycetota bacterium]|nr:hypothetical protein [Planctomycetota bacterium]